ncbi:excisionase family DNA-binding protein [Raineyella fluvialis]|uniref:Helix-turn-helix domain-containing protein n=1 Tax=Raineyella fluvialis TaxID=2662261 RepID=A0A5Q2FJA7_9ACTN|nr:excisionase family DNA-binding protein [Raineyella fluvialis]QGF24745.1 helix-turn-helix domain-containing protein [Raineyella fluvialis]
MATKATAQRAGLKVPQDHLPPVRRYATLDQASEYLVCSTRHVRDMIARGEITGYRMGSKSVRVDLNEIDAALSVIPTGGRLAATRGGAVA